MTTMRVVVADDEPLLLADLVRLLEALPDVQVVGQARNGFEVLELVEKSRPDALFLDIRMPGLNGMEVASKLDPADAPAVVFVTAFDQYAVQAFDAHAVDYLLKPFDPPRVLKAVQRVRARLGRDQTDTLARSLAAIATQRQEPVPAYLDRIAARGVRRTRVLDVREIRWIEANDNYVRLHTADGAHLSRRTMRELELQLDPRQFARVHRSAIVAIRRVKELRPLGDGDYEIILDSGTKLTLTRSYRDAFEARFGGIA